jgi:hypothetical protein
MSASLDELSRALRVDVQAVDVYGTGSKLSAKLRLDDGRVVEVESLTKAAYLAGYLPALMALHGVVIDGPWRTADSRRAVALITQVGERHVPLSDDDVARNWGVTFLERAHGLDVDMGDQEERWRAFTELRRRAQRTTNWTTFHPTSTGEQAPREFLLVGRDGRRHVPVTFLVEHVRTVSKTFIGARRLNARMTRVGWGHATRRATNPSNGSRLTYVFYVVEQGWDE